MKLIKNILFTFEDMVPNSKKKMFEQLNSFLTTVKLSKPNNYSFHSISYKIFDDKPAVESKEKYFLTDFKTDSGNYEININFSYFNDGVKIGFSYIKGRKFERDFKGTYLTIKISDQIMKSIMTNEFKLLVKKYFGRTVYSSENFETFSSSSYSSLFDYYEQVKGSKKRIVDAFIELNLACQRL